jgi:hypothetical protein
MVLTRIVTIGVVAIVTTAIGVMTIGLAETVRFGLIGLAAAGLLLGLIWLSGRNSSAQQPPSGGGPASAAKSTPKSKSKPQDKPKG